MNVEMLKPMFKPILGLLKKLSKENGIKSVVVSFDEAGELKTDFFNEDVVVMKRSEFDKMIKSLTDKKQIS